jgi:hypothetical protein
MYKISWRSKRQWIGKIETRKRIDRYTGESLEYASIQICINNPLDEQKMKKRRRPKIEKFTCVCFEPNVYKRLKPGDMFSFDGEVSFAPGSTYLIITRAFDALGCDITKEASPYFEGSDYLPF